MVEIALKMERINKSFSGVRVLNNVSFEARAGEVQALIGENGAGKSVLMQTLIGVHRPDSGDYWVGGKHVHFGSPAEAYQGGVGMVYQTFSLIPSLSVAENIFMGRLFSKRGRILWSKVYAETERYLRMIEANISPRTLVRNLRVAEQQKVEIAKVLSYKPLVVVMDEPSTALPRDEIQNLYKLIKLLREQGHAIVYISHKLEEIFDLADRVTVIRDGEIVGNNKTTELTPALLIEKITGRQISTDVEQCTTTSCEPGQKVLELRDLESKELFQDINLKVSEREIVGITGLVGAGKTEIGKAIFGALAKRHRPTGKIIFRGEEIDIRSHRPSKATRMGIGMVTEDRQREGIMPEQSVQFHTTILAFDRVAKGLYIIARRARQLACDIIKAVGLRPPDPDKQVRYFSGGNQQKVIVGKWLAARSKLLILDEPTQGVDVGAREEIYSVIRGLAQQGIAILLLSSDLREILTLSHRIIALRQGRIVSTMRADETSEGELLETVLGTKKN